MKCPNITFDKWEVTTWNDENYPNGKRVSIHGGDKAIMVAPKYYYTDIEFKANAKAISAVPEMIDALINTLNWMDSLEKGFHSNKKVQEWINKGENPHGKIKNALKKAGCTDE